LWSLRSGRREEKKLVGSFNTVPGKIEEHGEKDRPFDP
jgi:hypothetical protein